MLRQLSRVTLAAFMITAGVLHFVVDHLFVQIVPPFLPWPYAIVWVSGVFEFALGAGLLTARHRRLASHGLIALFVAVFPANLYMALGNVQLQGLPAGLSQPSQTALWLRLPLQLALIYWAWAAGRPPR